MTMRNAANASTARLRPEFDGCQLAMTSAIREHCPTFRLTMLLIAAAISTKLPRPQVCVVSCDWRHSGKTQRERGGVVRSAIEPGLSMVNV